MFRKSPVGVCSSSRNRSSVLEPPSSVFVASGSMETPGPLVGPFRYHYTTSLRGRVTSLRRFFVRSVESEPRGSASPSLSHPLAGSFRPPDGGTSCSVLSGDRTEQLVGHPISVVAAARRTRLGVRPRGLTPALPCLPLLRRRRRAFVSRLRLLGPPWGWRSVVPSLPFNTMLFARVKEAVRPRRPSLGGGAPDGRLE